MKYLVMFLIAVGLPAGIGAGLGAAVYGFKETTLHHTRVAGSLAIHTTSHHSLAGVIGLAGALGTVWVGVFIICVLLAHEVSD